ncbi:MAG: EscU/YscU/HrcU family type III secretion system export apparatus switch protein [Eubacteriales bacterium]
MSKPEDKKKKDQTITSRKNGRAVALKYDQSSGAPIIVASGMGYMAEKMVEVAEDNGVPIYEDNSLATMLSQLQLGQSVPPELYQAIVQIYVYFLKFDPNDPGKLGREREERRRLEKERQAAMKDTAELSQEPEPERVAPASLEDAMADLYGNQE